MSVKMPTTMKEERLRWVKPIANKEIKLVDAAKVCPHSKRSLERWTATYKEYGEEGLEPRSTRPKTQPNETPIWLKEKIIGLRKTMKECAKKLAWHLEDERVFIDKRTIGKILKREGLTRRYRIRKIHYKYIKVPLKAGELVEIDVKYVPDPVDGKRYYQFTAIDVALKWRLLEAYEDCSNASALAFLRLLMSVAPFRIMAIKTDNGSNFTNRYTGYLKSSDLWNPRLHPFDVWCQNHNVIHYLIDPGKPQQNGCVERSHRTDQEKFYDEVSFRNFEDLRCKLKLWNMYYNDTKHCSLNGKSPNEALLLA